MYSHGILLINGYKSSIISNYHLHPSSLLLNSNSDIPLTKIFNPLTSSYFHCLSFILTSTFMSLNGQSLYSFTCMYLQLSNSCLSLSKTHSFNPSEKQYSTYCLSAPMNINITGEKQGMLSNLFYLKIIWVDPWICHSVTLSLLSFNIQHLHSYHLIAILLSISSLKIK